MSALSVSQDEYLDDVWFLLHHSEEEGQYAMALTCYLDDSGTHSQSSAVVIGGLLMNRLQFKEFSRRWRKRLEKYKVSEPFHMKEFIRPHGAYAGMPPELKKGLFRELSEVTNEHKCISLSFSVPQEEFVNRVSPEVRKALIGPYAFTFFATVLLTRDVSLAFDGGARISYLVDHGCAHEDQLLEMHKRISDLEAGRNGQTVGTIAFDRDDDIPPLQAADAIAWSARRREVDGKLDGEFEPLNALLQEGMRPSHVHKHLGQEAIDMLAVPMNNWITKHGSLPSLKEFLVR